jgi:hypothetical protein
MNADRPQGRVPLALPEDRAQATAALFGGWFLLVAVFGAGCGSSRLVSGGASLDASREASLDVSGDASGSSSDASGDASLDASCSSGSVPKLAPATDAGATSPEAIEAPWLVLLDQALGRYMRGEILAYRGTMQGTSTLPTWFAYYSLSDGAIAESTALASLDFFPGSMFDWFQTVPAPFVNDNEAILIVYSLAGDPSMVVGQLANDQSMVFGQPESDPTLTATGGIVTGASGNRLTATCSDCAPSFWDRPAAIAFDLTAAGTVTTETYDGVTTSVPVNTTASVQLAVVPPCNLTFHDVKTLNLAAGPGHGSTTYLSLFELTGGEWVYHAIGSVATNQPLAQGDCTGGVSYLNYTIDLYVNDANLADYGVRNYVPGATYVQCPIRI